MFKHLFASMNEMLDDVISEYPSSTGTKRKQLQDKLRALRVMSDACIEEWLLFEEKLGELSRVTGVSLGGSDPLDPEFSGKRTDWFVRGQGYYKLHLFDEAIHEFEKLLKLQPDFNLARIYLAMSYLRKGETNESYTHFHFLTQLTENLQMKAISYNAMGCIQVEKHNMEKACEFFDMAYRTDPASIQPLLDLGVCCEKKGGLQFAFSIARGSS
ncbi:MULTISPECIES: tetratricopeptide repeat protein [unclassified Paenibacillus]|uniref:tetratricopeptide repeat protein n=1 Tax=unclassified Paenibacillus TaxID=185978 RepID=UPI001AE333DD|nr:MULTISPECIES: tetratricopeptide repeat protein [unclassified Paenibacillus]MBP1155301.1 tetratricopeptide (TPR) repeat protein [Paenibacillus sp. PvP091]MBP1169315.1 tetratricopeptide (TPR) repeat protein [Paenibacillus sp. PvR098]MBP2440343.1 tetratricopeptide (TPR) repeat protein [Paenibacillus sp. PvP052]